MQPTGQFYSVTPIDLLRLAVKPILDDYDIVLVDCPPNLGIITLNGLRISEGYIIPTVPDVLSTYGIPQIVTRVGNFAKEVAEDIEPLGIVITKYQEASTIHVNVSRDLRRRDDPPVFETVIRQANQIAAAAEFQSERRTLKQKYGYGDLATRYIDLAQETADSAGDRGMKLKTRLAKLAAAVAEQARRDAAFAAELESIMGSGVDALGADGNAKPAPVKGTRKGGRRAPAVLDPVDIARWGSERLRDALGPLDRPQLLDIVAEYGMDPGKLVMKWKDRARIADRIIQTAIARATKGDAFPPERRRLRRILAGRMLRRQYVSWFLFVDESGQDGRHSPYEVLAGIAVEDRELWRLIQALKRSQEAHFGIRLFDAYGAEAKGQKLLRTKTFRHANQKPALPGPERASVSLCSADQRWRR